jgi:hypothetical protein
MFALRGKRWAVAMLRRVAESERTYGRRELERTLMEVGSRKSGRAARDPARDAPGEWTEARHGSANRREAL